MPIYKSLKKVKILEFQHFVVEEMIEFNVDPHSMIYYEPGNQKKGWSKKF